DLAAELLSQFEQDPEQNSLPAVSFDKLDAFEERLRHFTIESPPLEEEPQPEPEPETVTVPELEHSDSSIFADDEQESDVSLDLSEITQSDVLTEDELYVDSPEPEPEEVARTEQTSESTDDLLSRIDGLMSEVSEPEEDESDLSVTDSTIILQSSIAGDSSETFADEEFLLEEKETQAPEPRDLKQFERTEEFAGGEDSSSQKEADKTSSLFEEPVFEPPAAEIERTPMEKVESEPSSEPEQADSTPEPSPREDKSEVLVDEEETFADDGQPSDLSQPQTNISEELPESVSTDEPQSEPVPESVQPEMAEASGERSELTVEQPSSDSDFDISSMPSEEQAASSVEHEPPPALEREPVCPTPLVVPDLQPDPEDFAAPSDEIEQPVPEAAEEESELVGHHEWEEYVKAVMDESSPLHDSIGVLLVELDEIESVTKEFGKQIVEDLMLEFNRRLADLCSDRELSCRYGSGQFTVACPGLDLKAAYKRGDQLRKLFEKIRFDVMPIKKLTVSVGVTAAEPKESFDQMIHRVEFALHRSRKIGNNCCVALDSEEVRTEKQKERDEEGSRILLNEFVLTAEFEAMIASDMIVYKLGGFLYDLGAKLIKVDR
ncbi:MAG TPA: diguanylate cyclase, partial [Planctomycetaceae bacterium]|nr:diguanylate cyclase [Planctomycetaceae bacterium]